MDRSFYLLIFYFLLVPVAMPAQQNSSSGVSFGQNFGILNLDWMPLLINAVAETTEGKTLINNYIQWNDAIHRKSRRPLTIFTILAFNRGQPEVEDNRPFAKLIAPFGSCEEGSPNVGIDSRFILDERDIILRKTRWAAIAGNNLEQILRAQHIDTVVISGLTLSGVVMATVYRLFDLDYNIYVIADNVLDLPLEQNEAFSKVMLETLLPRMNVGVISLAEAIRAIDDA